MPWKTSVSPAQAPDSVPLSVTVVANLNACANSLMAYQNCGKTQSERLAGMLNDTAKCYDDVDSQYAGRMGDPGRLPAVEAIPAPQSSIPPPTLPDAPPPPAMVSAVGYSTVEQNDQQLSSGPGTGALEGAITDYKDAAKMLTGVEKPQFENWEGTAAKAAMDRFDELYQWLGELSTKWNALASDAEQIKTAHNTAVSEHGPILTAFNECMRRLTVLMNDPSADPKEIEFLTRMLTKLQQDSNDVLDKYARSASFSPPNVSDPPFGSGRTGNPSVGHNGGSEGDSKERGGGGGDSKDSKSDSPLVSPASANHNVAQQKPGAPAGGASPAAGRSPSGEWPAGAGAGGSPPGGLPGGMPHAGTRTLPKLNRPSLKPASLGGGGGAKGGGGGMPKMPLGPAVGSESVAPTPTAATGGLPGAAGPAPAGTGMGGGAMGGGGMGHGGGQQGKEKRRDPNLSLDEDLYKEDRAWTEPVIGRQMPPRRKAPDGKDGGS